MLPRQEHFEFVLKKITSEKKRIPVIIFCDPGVDDALMLLQMLNQKKYVIAGIIPVRGNASSRACLENTLALSEYIGRTDIKIYPGRNEKFRGFKVYGQRGLNGFSLPRPNAIKPQSVDGITFTCNFLKNNTAIIISTAGLTEPAAVLKNLLKNSPQGLHNILGISLMGGVINTTQEANFPIKGKRFTEANVADNPIATKELFMITKTYNIPIFLSTLDLTHSILVSKSDLTELQKKKSKLSQCAYKLISNTPKHYQRRFGKGPDQQFRQPLHDVHATSCLLHPELYQGQWVDLEINKKLTSPHITIKYENTGNVFLLSLPSLYRQRLINAIVNDYSNLN